MKRPEPLAALRGVNQGAIRERESRIEGGRQAGRENNE